MNRWRRHRKLNLAASPQNRVLLFLLDPGRLMGDLGLGIRVTLSCEKGATILAVISVSVAVPPLSGGWPNHRPRVDI